MRDIGISALRWGALGLAIGVLGAFVLGAPPIGVGVTGLVLGAPAALLGAAVRGERHHARRRRLDVALRPRHTVA